MISLPQPAPASPEGARCSCRSTGCGGDSPLESQGPCLQLCRPRQHSKNLGVLPEKNREKGHDNNFKCVGAAGEEKRGSVPVPRLSRAGHRGLPAAGRSGITRAIDEERERERQRRDRPAGWARVSLSRRQKRARARTARGGLVLPRGRRWTGQPRCGQTDRQTAEICRGTRAAQPPAGQLREHGAGAHRGDTASDPQHSPPTWDDGEHSSALAAARLLGHLCCRDIT